MNASEEQFMAEAKTAYCDEFINSLPEGDKIMLGENGSTLSVGERKRISIDHIVTVKIENIIYFDVKVMYNIRHNTTKTLLSAAILGKHSKIIATD